VSRDRAVTVLYDDRCAFCRASLALLLKWDRQERLRPVPIEGPEGDRLLRGMTREQRLGSAHAIGSDGRVLSGADAAPTLLRALPGGRPLAWAARVGRPLVALLYAATTAGRPLLSRGLPQRARGAADRVVAQRRRLVTPEEPTA
jgi:predicted DCC family thiol-disulfide oxidoreductase YuxK